MAFKDGYNFENLIDEGRNLVIEELGRQLESRPDDICKCNDCVVDMAAAALNTMPPRYHSSLIGSIYQADGLNDPAYSKRLQDAVKTAITRVGGNPSHD
jgi:competence protein ComFB